MYNVQKRKQWFIKREFEHTKINEIKNGFVCGGMHGPQKYEQMVILSQNQFILYRLARIMST